MDLVFQVISVERSVSRLKRMEAYSSFLGE